MELSNRNTPANSGIDVTLEVSDPSFVHAPLPPAACPRVAFVEGSGSGMSAETRVLLRRRLRAAALVFFCGSLAFFLRGLIWPRVLPADSGLVRAGTWLDLLHLVQIAALGLASYKLCWRCGMTLTALRVAEAIIFGITALFLGCLQYFATQVAIEQSLPPFNPTGMWFTLLFTYAIYIPNTWRRAAIILGLMAIAPIVVMLFDWHHYKTHIMDADLDGFSGVAMMMALGYGSSVYGTYMINSLRIEAFAAKQLGQYRLKSLLGAGGMGEVYLAEHQLLKRPCAIKLIRPGMARDPRALARFEREVRQTAKLSHWNTVEIFDYGHTDDGTFYYVMEYLPGLSLSELVERHGPLPASRVIYLLAQTCDALSEAHSQGLIHRDIKPGNIFSAQRGGVYDVAKLLDFGLAKPLAEPSSTQLTQEGMITGSPLYMSPEQAIGETAPDARSDIYSLGGVAYYLLTGKPPFDDSNAMKVLVAHAHDEVVPPSRHRAEVPADVEQIVLRCLEKKPENRFASAAALAASLRACAAADDWTREQAAAWWAERRQQPAAKGTAVAAVMPEVDSDDGQDPSTVATDVNLPKGLHV